MLRGTSYFVTFALFLVAASAVAERSAARSPRTAVTQGRVDQGASALFSHIASVLQSRRCIGCHPRGDRPTQGDDNHNHLMNVQRGSDNAGMPGMRCSTCHQQHNNEMAGIPGGPGWQLAPRSMGWSGLSQGQLCRTLLDRRTNGGRTATELVAHMLDAEVNYAWVPDGQRNPPTLSLDELERWVAAGAPCPK
jgi:hypothetical protein